MNIIKSIVLLGFIGTILFCGCGGSKSGDSGTMFRADMQRTGYFPEASITQINGIQWQFKANEVLSFPPVAGHGKIYAVSYKGNLCAIDPETGELEWETILSEGITSTPLISGNNLYIGCGNKCLQAVDCKNGNIKWKFLTEASVQVSPAIVSGRLIFGDVNGMLYIVDASSGKKIASKKLPARMVSEPSIFGNTAYFGCEDRTLKAVNIENGNSLWSFKDRFYIYGCPIPVGGKLYFGNNSRVFYCLDCNTGTEIWRLPIGGATLGDPAYADQSIFAATASGQLRKLDAESGEIMGTYTVGHREASPIVVGNIVLISSKWEMVGLDKNSLEKVFSYKYPYPLGGKGILGSPCIYDGKVIVTGRDGTLYAFSLSTADAAKQPSAKKETREGNEPLILNTLPDFLRTFKRLAKEEDYENLKNLVYSYQYNRKDYRDAVAAGVMANYAAGDNSYSDEAMQIVIDDYAHSFRRMPMPKLTQFTDYIGDPYLLRLRQESPESFQMLDRSGALIILVKTKDGYKLLFWEDLNKIINDKS